MFNKETPSSVMYADLKTFGGVANKDAARLLLSSRVMYGGRAPRDRVDERTFLSREVVHVDPSRVDPSQFGDFATSSQVLAHRIVAKHGGNEAARVAVHQHYCGPAAREMAAVLKAHGLDDKIYINLVNRAAKSMPPENIDGVALLVMTFVATGCLANPSEAAFLVDQVASKQLSADLGTISVGVTADVSGVGDEDAVQGTLGLIRVIDGMARPPIHPLSAAPSGTVVGSLVTGDGTVNDVDVDVSRHHLHIWQEEGTWYCQGMGSTNGTVLISGADRSTQVVEPPKRERSGQTVYPPVPLQNSDELCLGKTTRFLVMKIKG